MSIKWPKKLIEDIAKRRCVIFLGSGISMNSTNDNGERPPSWYGFLESGITQLNEHGKGKHVEIAQKYLVAQDLLMCCEVIKHGLGRDEFNSLLKDKFLKPKFNTAEIHQTIFDLDSRIVITPNFDKIYDSYAVNTSKGTVIVKAYYDNDIIDCIRTDEPLIIKMHGTIDKPDNLIFTRYDYSSAWNNHTKFYRILESLLLSHTFIFLGAGINDPDIKLLLESHAFSYGLSRKHYFVIPDDDIDEITKEIYSDLLHLNFITFKKDKDFSELKKSLKELSIIVEEKREH